MWQNLNESSEIQVFIYFNMTDSKFLENDNETLLESAYPREWNEIEITKFGLCFQKL